MTGRGGGVVLGRDSGNHFRFPDFASHTGRFRLIFVRISSVVSFRVDIQQLSLFLIDHFILLWHRTDGAVAF